MKPSAREYCSHTITQQPFHYRRPISDYSYHVSEEGGHTATSHVNTLAQSSQRNEEGSDPSADIGGDPKSIVFN